jgi:uncharacterized membrane protein YcaP (DUF421 family)
MEIVLRASVVFFFLLLITRGTKKRALGDMAPFEMLLLVTLGDIVQQGVTQEDMSLTGAILAVSTFAFWVTVLSWVTWRWRGVGRVVDGVPVVLVQDGQPVEAVMAAERMPLDELHEAARQEGLDDLTKVRMAVLEPSGRISFIKTDT